MISIVICSITPSRFAAVSENLRRLLGNEPHEFIQITDAKSITEGYNRGIRQSRGDTIIICHDDIEILVPDFRDRLLSRLEQFDLIGVAGSTRVAGPQWIAAGPPHIFGQVAHIDPKDNDYLILVWGTPAACIPKIRLLDGLFMAGRRKVFEQIPFDEETFAHWHFYDVDFSLRASQAGFELAVCNDLMVIHASMGSFDAQWKKEAELFVNKHRASFEPVAKTAWNAMAIKVATKQDVAEILRARYWAD